MDRKRNILVAMVAGAALALAGCNVVVPVGYSSDSQPGNYVFRDGNGDVTDLIYGGDALEPNLVNDLNNHCANLSGADMGTVNDPNDPPNSVVVNCWQAENTYDSNASPSDSTVSFWCEVSDCGNSSMTDRVIHDASDFSYTYAYGTYARAEKMAAAIRDAEATYIIECIHVTTSAITLESTCP